MKKSALSYVEQQQLEIRDERRKTREAKRYGKQVQEEKSEATDAGEEGSD